MKKVLTLVLTLSLLVALLTGCHVESVQEHDATSPSVEAVTGVSEAVLESITTADTEDTKAPATEVEDDEVSLPSKKPTKSVSKSSKAKGKAKATTKKPSTPAPKKASKPKYYTVTVSVDSSVVSGLDCPHPSGAYSVRVKSGTSIFEASRLALANLNFEYTDSSFGKYISGIGGLREKVDSAHPQSGWRYKVNGTFPGEACDLQKVSGNCTVCWVYALKP